MLGGVLGNVYNATKSLIKGHLVTLKELRTPKITVHYPDERLELPLGSRGMPALKVNQDTGLLNCTACGVCARECPVDAIEVEAVVGEKGRKKRYPAIYNLDMTHCMQCNLCVEACPFDALEMSDAFEISRYDLDDLIFDKEQLAEIWKTHKAVRITGGEKL